MAELNIKTIYKQWQKNAVDQNLVFAMRKSDRLTENNFLKQALTVKDPGFLKFLLNSEFGLQDSILKGIFVKTAFYDAYKKKRADAIEEFTKHIDFQHDVKGKVFFNTIVDVLKNKKNDNFDQKVADLLVKRAKEIKMDNIPIILLQLQKDYQNQLNKPNQPQELLMALKLEQFREKFGTDKKTDKKNNQSEITQKKPKSIF